MTTPEQFATFEGWGRKIARYSLPAKAKQAAAAMRQKGGGDHASK